MSNITNQMTAQTPSGFGMPTSGRAFVPTTGLTSACPTGIATGVVTTGAIAAVVRDRAVVTGLMGYAEKSHLWTTAWRPPTS